MKRIVSGTLLLALTAATMGRSQEELPPPRSYEDAQPVSQTPVATETAETFQQGPSAWIRYSHNRSECCGPMGGDGPIAIELYFRTGPSNPWTGGKIHSALDTGWMFAGGGRSLFFNVDQTSAWTVDLGISNISNNAGDPEIEFVIPGRLLNVIPIQQTVNVRAMNRTYANLTFGKENYLVGSGCDSGCNWRLGWDAGPRLGAARIEYNRIGGQEGYQRDGSLAYGFLTALHTDIEWGTGCCKWLAGFRWEMDATWTEIRHINSNEIWNANFLLTVGVRY
jgi:hypothetical protein